MGKNETSVVVKPRIYRGGHEDEKLGLQAVTLGPSVDNVREYRTLVLFPTGWLRPTVRIAGQKSHEKTHCRGLFKGDEPLHGCSLNQRDVPFVVNRPVVPSTYMMIL